MRERKVNCISREGLFLEDNRGGPHASIVISYLHIEVLRSVNEIRRRIQMESGFLSWVDITDSLTDSWIAAAEHRWMKFTRENFHRRGKGLSSDDEEEKKRKRKCCVRSRRKMRARRASTSIWTRFLNFSVSEWLVFERISVWREMAQQRSFQRKTWTK